MRTLILRQPPAHAAESLPPCFAASIEEPDLREWLAHPGAKRCIVPVSPGARFEDVVAEAFGGGGAPDDAIVVVYVPTHTLVTAEDARALDLDAAFARTAAATEETAEQLIEAAEGRFEADDWDGAEQLLRRADALLHQEASVRRAEVLAGLGEISRLQGRTAEAAALLDRALSLSPTHYVALRGRGAIARSLGEHATSAALLSRLADLEHDTQERSALLGSVASESLEAARGAIARALELCPGDPTLLERLKAAHEAAGRWDDAVTVSVTIAESITDPSARAHALALAAGVCASRAGNAARAVALYEAAIADDPQVPGAFSAIEETLLRAQDHAGVALAYERQIERLPDEESRGERVSLLHRLACVCRDQLSDQHRAIKVMDQITREDPRDVGARLDLADLLAGIGERALATRCLEVAAQNDPLAPPVYRRLHAMFSAEQDTDRAFSANAALVALGEATTDEQLAYAELAPHSPLTFERPFDDDVWAELLPEPRFADVELLFASLEEAAIDAWIARSEAQGPLPAPPPNSRQDAATTTVAAVRSFAWASRLLGVAEPALHAAPANTKISAATLPGRTPIVLLGRPLLTGRSPIELVFIAARHLAYFRPGRRVLAYYPTVDDLDLLLRASVSLARPDLTPPASLPPGAAELCLRLHRALGPAERARLTEALGRLWSSGGVVDLAGWMRAAEATACRAALLATGDVTVARTLLSISGGPAAGLSAADRARDLLAFSVSQKYAVLRRMLGVRLG
jgi:tetratricopeptide (TPR) repeat protein